MSLLGYTKKQFLKLDPEEICWQLSKEEILHLFRVFGAYWSYDFRAADEGRVGCHAELSNDLCSSGFFYSKPVLDYDNLCQLLAKQLVMKYRSLRGLPASRVLGIPHGATKLGVEVARELALPHGVLKKTGSGFALESEVSPGETLLFVEDFLRGATNLSNAIWASLKKQPQAKASNYQLVILNRGSFSVVQVECKNYGLASLASHRVDDWRPANCPLCNNLGSVRIKPKESEENWQRLNTAQLTV